MDNFYSLIDNLFNILLDKYENNIDIINDLIELKKNIINNYDITNNKSYEYYIINSIKKKLIKIDNNGNISSI